MRRGSIDGLGRGADEVGFGCCEPQRLGAARETTASRLHAWLGIALGATLNIPEKQNGFPNQIALASARAADWQMADVAPSTPLDQRRELAAPPTSATLPSSGEAERYFREEAHQARAAAVRQRRLEFDEQEKASAAARGRAGANKAPRRAAPAAAPKPSARVNPPPAAPATSPPPRARKPARAPAGHAAPSRRRPQTA